jgi:hypothetical protein
LRFRCPAAIRDNNSIGFFAFWRCDQAVSQTDLDLNPIPNKNSHPLIMALKANPLHQIAEIALRLEAILCSEAITERRNGSIHRILAPASMQMDHDIIMTRVTIAKNAQRQHLQVSASHPRWIDYRSLRSSVSKRSSVSFRFEGDCLPRLA